MGPAARSSLLEEKSIVPFARTINAWRMKNLTGLRLPSLIFPPSKGGGGPTKAPLCLCR